MDDNQFSSEKEPFLLDHPVEMHHRHRQAWNPKLVVAIWLTSQIIIFAIFGSVLILTIKDTILNAVFSNIGIDSPSREKTFGGLPVQYDDPIGPYVTCPSIGGPSTALQAGCSLDLFANGWVPRPCFDAEKHDYFISQRDYYFWLDEDGRQRVHQDKLLEGTLEYPELFISFEEHYDHCRYLLNTTKRYAHDPSLGVLDLHVDDGHMDHCIDFLRESREPLFVEVGTKAYFGYRKCYLPSSETASVA